MTGKRADLEDVTIGWEPNRPAPKTTDPTVLTAWLNAELRDAVAEFILEGTFHLCVDAKGGPEMQFIAGNPLTELTVKMPLADMLEEEIDGLGVPNPETGAPLVVGPGRDGLILYRQALVEQIERIDAVIKGRRRRPAPPLMVDIDAE